MKSRQHLVSPGLLDTIDKRLDGCTVSHLRLFLDATAKLEAIPIGERHPRLLTEKQVEAIDTSMVGERIAPSADHTGVTHSRKVITSLDERGTS